MHGSDFELAIAPVTVISCLVSVTSWVDVVVHDVCVCVRVRAQWSQMDRKYSREAWVTLSAYLLERLQVRVVFVDC